MGKLAEHGQAQARPARILRQTCKAEIAQRNIHSQAGTKQMIMSGMLGQAGLVGSKKGCSESCNALNSVHAQYVTAVRQYKQVC